MRTSIEKRPVVINKITYDILLKQDEPLGAIALYNFYYYTTIWQETNQPWCTTSFCAKGLKTTELKIRRYKKILLKLGLIEDVVPRSNNTNKIKGHFIKVHYLLHPDGIPECGEDTLHPDGIPECGECQSVEKQQTNALNNNNKEMLKTNSRSNKVAIGGGLLSLEKKKKSFHHQCAVKLAKAILQKKHINYSSSISNWTKEFETLERKMMVDKERIQKVLDWFCDNLGQKGIQEAYSGKHFKSKFLNIEQSMQRNQTNKENKNIVISNDTLSIISFLQKKQWPKGSSEQLPQAVEMSLLNFKSFLSKHKAVLQKYNKPSNTKEKRINRFANYIQKVLPPSNTFIRYWFEHVQSQIINWEQWNGNLLSFVFSEDAKQFHIMGKKWAYDYCHDELRWKVYVEAMECS